MKARKEVAEAESGTEAVAEDLKDEEGQGEGQTEFTMETMLRSLGIDSEVLGWDAEEDRWRE